MFALLLKGIYIGNSGTGDISNVLSHRVGSQMSTRILDKDIECDYSHNYTKIFRQDMLDYENQDYYSFRRLTGKNISKTPSSFLVYSEAMDVPIEFDKIEIFAINTNTKNPLVVECLHNTKEKRLKHTFKINFEAPKITGEHFDISYSIRIPKELSVLNKDKEITSISLVRIMNRPISELEFNVCLDFNPRAIKVFGRNLKNNYIIEIDGAGKSLYNPSNEMEEVFNIKWTNSIPSIIRFKTKTPKFDQYIIQYFR
jgi:hypothetical protein